MVGPELFPSPYGLAESDPDLGKRVHEAWDLFLDVVAATDLSGPSRRSGLSAKDLCIQMGAWDDNRVMVGIVEAAEAGGGGDPGTTDANGDRLLKAHRGASDEEVVAALRRSQQAIADWLGSDGPARLGAARVVSPVGTLPLLSLVHAGTYELATRALDLAPAGAPDPPTRLLDRGLAAILDVTGALSSRLGIHMTVTAQSPDGGWAFTSTASGWTTQQVAPGRFDGSGAKGSLADLLDAAAGQAFLPKLLLRRRITVQQLPGMMRLAPLLTEVPGIPGGAALRAGVAGLGAVTGGWDRLRRR